MENLLSFVFIALAALGLLQALFSMWMSMRAKSWPVTTGYIDHESVNRESDEDGDWFEAEVRYHYRVRGIEYQGRRIAFGLLSSSVEQWVLKPFLEATAAAPVTPVHYHPQTPRLCTLLTGIKMFHWWQLLFFVLFNVVLHAFILKPA